MWRIVKLIIYFYLYQVLFTALVTLPEIWTQLMNNGGHTDGFTGAKITITATCLALVLSGITMIWHLIHFKYVKFNLKSFGEVSGKTMVLSIVWVVASMMFANLCCEFLNLPDYTQTTAYAMSRNVLGILSITIMAPLVEELLFRGAIQGHLMRKWKMPYLGIVVSSLIFGVVHGNPAQIPFAFVVGIALGWVYYLTGSLLPGVLMHFINNGSSVLLYTLSGDPDATMVSSLGETGALALAAVGMVLTVVCIFVIRKKVVDEPVQWNEENNLQA